MYMYDQLILKVTPHCAFKWLYTFNKNLTLLI